MLYRKIEPLEEGTPVQYVGMYVTRWGRDAEPSVGFVEVEDVETALRQARRALERWPQLRDSAYETGWIAQRFEDIALLREGQRLPRVSDAVQAAQIQERNEIGREMEAALAVIDAVLAK